MLKKRGKNNTRKQKYLANIYFLILRKESGNFEEK